MLAEVGFKTTALERGSSARALLEERLFDVLLVDIHLSNISGLVIGEKMRKRHGERADIQLLGGRRGRQHRQRQLHRHGAERQRAIDRSAGILSIIAGEDGDATTSPS